MKIYVHYDSEGTIQSVFSVDAPEGCGGMLAPEPGLFMAEVDADALYLKTDASNPESLLGIVEGYKVSTPLPRLMLVQKTM